MADLTTPELGKLVERLRDLCTSWDGHLLEGDDNPPRAVPCRDLLEAATAIETLERQWDAMARASLSSGTQAATAILRQRATERERDELKAEVERLRGQGAQTVLGMPIVLDPSMPPDTVRIVNADGTVIAALRTPEESP